MYDLLLLLFFQRKTLDIKKIFQFVLNLKEKESVQNVLFILINGS